MTHSVTFADQEHAAAMKKANTRFVNALWDAHPQHMRAVTGKAHGDVVG